MFNDMPREALINLAVAVALADMDNIGTDPYTAYQEAKEADPLDLIAFLETIDPETLEAITA